MNVTASSTTISSIVQRTRNQPSVAEAKVSEASVALPATSISSVHELTSISSSSGLNTNMNGSTAVRSA
ncbi:Uncharacterised protein [Bordetella pertussis]|nr:Uncharacterised protein [Bordetella pertussis]CFP07950.1 Uncharacterised protein [Bordetella pertussis]CFU71672.1 Uncharacterised protein [Bordetella pertussis]CFW42129.1 Uncharacterised protein [Bordetella pertussis]CFW58905.1 Uncharacterised protein [Bordetella pertussis]